MDGKRAAIFCEEDWNSMCQCMLQANYHNTWKIREKRNGTLWKGCLYLWIYVIAN